MVAGITVQSTGKAEFAASREEAWHKLGVVAGKDLGVMEAAELAGLLSWNLRKVPLIGVSEADGMLPVAGKHLVVRDAGDGGARAIGVVGDRYHLVPQENWLPFIEQVLESPTGEGWGVHVDAMGSIEGGRLVFATLAFEGADFAIGGFDMHKTYLTVISSHDGSLSLTAKPTTIRVVCKNTVNAALGESSARVYRLKHLSGAGDLTGKAKDAQMALGAVFAQRDAIMAEAEALLAKKVTDEQFKRIIEATYPEIKALNLGDQQSPRSIALAQVKQAELFGLWNGATVQGAGIGGTAYGAVQAVGEHLDWLGTVKGVQEHGDAATARAVREFVGRDAVDKIKLKAHAAVGAVLGG